MPRRGTRETGCVLMVLALVAGAAAQESGSPAPVASAASNRVPPAPYHALRFGTGPAAAISSTHRFMAAGAMSSSERVSLAAAAEEAADRLEAVVGLKIPFWRNQPVELIARAKAESPSGSVIRAQGWVDRGLAQKLIIVNPDRADQEDILEGLCWLLLNRCVITRQGVEERERSLGAVPDWLSVGAAQNLYQSLRSRNRQIAVRTWADGEGLSFAEVLGLEILPPGRWGQKAVCGAVVDCIAESDDAAAVFDGLFARLARGERITPAWMSKALAGRDSPKELEKAWDLWLARQTQVKPYGGRGPADAVAALQGVLAVDPLQYGFTGDDGLPDVMTPADLIEFRKERWVPKLAAGLSLRVKGLGLGESPGFRRVVNKYGDFFDALVRRGGWLGRLTGRGESRVELLVLLKLADGALADFQNARAAGSSALSGVVADMDRFMTREELEQGLRRR